jgi:hypothetical protein
MNAELRTFEPRRPEAGSSIPRLINLEEFAKLWSLPITWLRESCRTRCADPLPVYRLGRYVRVDLNDPSLAEWLKRRHIGGGNAR